MDIGIDLQEDVALAPYTTFGVGGPATWFLEATSETEIIEAVRWAGREGVPLFVLGGGSNLLVSDDGFDGLVLRVALKGIETAEDGNCRVFRVYGGEEWDCFVDRAVGENCAGIECLAGIPGTVGGTPVQNVGAYGQEVSETIRGVRVLDLETHEFNGMTAEECRFSYRSSLFNSTAKGRYLVTRVDYYLNPGGGANLRYADLQKAFPAGSEPELQEVTAEVRRIRQAKGMLLMEGDADTRSAGSFFKNPVISSREFEDLSKRLGIELPHYPGGMGRVKLPAAWLIEHAGFAKGFALGRAGISSRHTLALINRGGATAADLLALRDLIIAGVQEKFRIELKMEPVMVGF